MENTEIKSEGMRKVKKKAGEVERERERRDGGGSEKGGRCQSTAQEGEP